MTVIAAIATAAIRRPRSPITAPGSASASRIALPATSVNAAVGEADERDQEADHQCHDIPADPGMKAQLGGAQLGVVEFVPHLPPPCGQIRVLLRWRRGGHPRWLDFSIN
jgi:hypothetical protein